MHRRAVLALSATIPLAGCSDLLGSGGSSTIDATLSDGDPHEFSASEGDELSVTVSVTEAVTPNEDEAENEVNSISFRISAESGSPILATSISEGEEFTDTVTVEQGGTHTVAVTNGEADVLIEVA